MAKELECDESEAKGNKMTKYASHEIWIKSLQIEQSHLRRMEANGLYSSKDVEKTRHRIERIWNNGLPEWRKDGLPSRLP